jgi:anti-anti-sigma regulatory factor
MKITINDNNIIIKGQIRTLNDYLEIRDVIQKIIKTQSYKSILINILDSPTITSSIIGFLIKVINLDNVQVSLSVRHNDLYNMLVNLNLVSIFNVTKI